MRRGALGLLVVLVTTSSCALSETAAVTSGTDVVGVHVVPVRERAQAPHLSGQTLAGSSFDLSEHLGHGIVIVNVWASWCAPCRREAPILRRAARVQPGVLVVGVDERDDQASARAFVSSVGADYPSLVDRDRRLLLQLPMLPHDAIPSTLFIDRRGRVAAWVVGPLTASSLGSVLARVGAAT